MDQRLSRLYVMFQGFGWKFQCGNTALALQVASPHDFNLYMNLNLMIQLLLYYAYVLSISSFAQNAAHVPEIDLC